MVWPLFPLLCGTGIFAGVLGLAWYDGLSQGEKDRVDGLATQLAWELYAMSLDELTQQQKTTVYDVAKSRLGL